MTRHRHLASKIISIVAALSMLVTGFAVAGSASAVTSGGGGLPIAKKLLLM